MAFIGKDTHSMKAIWNGNIIAESDSTVVIEGNHYFPIESVAKGFMKESDTTTVCNWKGTANYYSVTVDGKENTDAAWYYAETTSAAEPIKGHVAFWRGVEVTT
jgi:uncharacterized protein (DUF427 family)